MSAVFQPVPGQSNLSCGLVLVATKFGALAVRHQRVRGDRGSGAAEKPFPTEAKEAAPTVAKGARYRGDSPP